MKKIIIFFLGASLFMVNLSAYSQTTYYTTAGIPESSTLTLRAWPSHASQPLASIPYGTTEIIPTGKNILLNTDNWLQVAFENQVGWVEEAYIAQLAVQPTEQTPQQAPIFATPEPAQTVYAPQETTYNQYNNQPAQQEIPWSASADSIYQDPHAAVEPQLPDVITTSHSVVVIPQNSEEVDLRQEDVIHNRYSSVDTSFSLQYDQH